MKTIFHHNADGKFQAEVTKSPLKLEVHEVVELVKNSDGSVSEERYFVGGLVYSTSETSQIRHKWRKSTLRDLMKAARNYVNGR